MTQLKTSQNRKIAALEMKGFAYFLSKNMWSQNTLLGAYMHASYQSIPFSGAYSFNFSPKFHAKVKIVSDKSAFGRRTDVL